MSGLVQCSRTLAVHFPPTIYRSSGSTQVLPDLVKSLDIANVQAIQFVPNGIVRVTYKESAQCDAALAGGFSFRGANLRVTPVDARTRLVYLRDLPAEVPDEPVRVFFRKYGVLHSLSPQFHPGLSDVKNGTRVAKVTLTKDLPSTVRIAGFDARIWYQGQPQSCPVCRQFGHRVRDCPLNGLCRRCRQPGHMARECTSRRPSASVPGMPESASAVVDESAAADASDVPASMSDDDPDCASEPGTCSGDEEVLRLVPTSVLASRARKRSAPSPPPAGQKTFCSDEPSVDLRDNELSPPSDVPGTPEFASAVVVPVPASFRDPVPGTPVSASAVVVRDGTPVAASAVPVASESAPVESAPAEPVPAKSVPAETPPLPYWEAIRRTGYGRVLDDGCGGQIHFDFGSLSRSIEIESTSLEYDRFVKYVHHGYGRLSRASRCDRLPAGSPAKFPGQL